jgi:acetyl-CoA acetyltransferase
VKLDRWEQSEQADNLPTLRPVFSKEGAITAGDASDVTDGAAAVLDRARGAHIPQRDAWRAER